MQNNHNSLRVWGFPFASKLRWSITYNGLFLTLLGIVVRCLPYGLTSAEFTGWYKKAISRRFDKRFNVNTAGIVLTGDLDISPLQKSSASMYKGTDGITFGVVISALKIEYSKFVFIDYGSGRGKALILAAHFHFKRIVGVEISSALHIAAVENIGKMRSGMIQCLAISSVCEDAANFVLPDEPLVIYLFHPFNRTVMIEVLERIESSLQASKRMIKIIYAHPINSDLYSDEDLSELLRASSLREVELGIKTPGWDVFESS